MVLGCRRVRAFREAPLRVYDYLVVGLSTKDTRVTNFGIRGWVWGCPQRGRISGVVDVVGVVESEAAGVGVVVEAVGCDGEVSVGAGDHE